MGLFGKILDKLGMSSGTAPPAATTSAGPPPGMAAGPPSAGPKTAPTPGAAPPQGAPTPPFTARPPADTAQQSVAVGVVDVIAQLEERAAANPQKLNWRTSIVDLLKLLDIDSSLAARRELATELGCPPELMDDSAKMNTWLHKEVLMRVAANGGYIPTELLG